MIAVPLILDVLALLAIAFFGMVIGFSSESSRGKTLDWPDFLLTAGFWLLPVVLLVASYCVSLGRQHWAFHANSWFTIVLVALMMGFFVIFMIESR